MIHKNLKFAGLDDVVLLETKNWKANAGRRFDMVKGQTINIPKNLTHLRVGLGWQTKLDLDASVLTLDATNNRVDWVYFNHLTSKDGAISHKGDDRVGGGGGDDETILINLSKVGNKVETIWIVVNIYDDGKTFYDVEGAFCRLLDHYSG